MTWIQIELVDDSAYNLSETLSRIAVQIAAGDMSGVIEVRNIDENGHLSAWKGWERVCPQT
jgi:hypothetical protein